MPDNKQLVDVEMLREAQRLMGQKFDRVLGYYFEDAIGYLQAIETALRERNIKEVIVAAHTLKSSSLQLGAVGMSGFAAELEARGKEILAHGGEAGFLIPLASNMQEIFQLTKARLQAATQ